jgi:predicted GH43/DUF377 family glycosyl hydrolase
MVMRAGIWVVLILAMYAGGCRGQGGHGTGSPARYANNAALHNKWRQLGGTDRWKPYPNNPIIRPGDNGQWDSWAVMSMTVVRVGETFHLYYEGGLTGCGDLQIGHATSTDGLDWVKDPGNPVLRPGKNRDWDDGATWDPFVIYEDGLFKMWYGGERIGHRDFQCGYAVSKDGTHFTKKGKISTFEVGDIGDMHVYHDTKARRYYMYYWDRSLKKADRLRAAVSQNETDFDFENAQSISIRGEVPGHRYTQVFKVDDTWYMFYGYENKPKTGFAVSADGLNFKVANNGLLPSEDAEILPIEDDLYFMFYCPMGLQDEKGCDVRLAIFNGNLSQLVCED